MYSFSEFFEPNLVSFIEYLIYAVFNLVKFNSSELNLCSSVMSNFSKEDFDSICRVCTSSLDGNQSKSIFDLFVTAPKTLEFCLRSRVSLEFHCVPIHLFTKSIPTDKEMIRDNRCECEHRFNSAST